jgi:hypothetical protein
MKDKSLRPKQSLLTKQSSTGFMQDEPDLPLDEDTIVTGPDGRITGAAIICGYCRQGRHSECNESICSCADRNHRY